ncbi:cobalt-precorrin 5A hydrolase [Candidatus Merdisoma sp. JLR.KK006]|uniref:cobalt-precorrin 5A hydrolase n=1 Tax=Candidatus Merdisoma sp. JLR.KK006 TaxID=3112626 RepID=UPI002FEFCEA8
MKLAVIAFTRSGCRFAEKIREAVIAKENECEIWGKGKEACAWGIPALEESLREWTGRQFAAKDALLFIGATGIAVRAIAPFVKSKASDPAVLCMDEQGRFVISLLSGHLGGANELTKGIASICGAVPVITTATDIDGRFSVDSFARREHLYLDNLKLAKEISAEVLENRTVGLYSDFELSGQIPFELALGKQKEIGISISLDDSYDPFPKTLHLVPGIVVLGIGCKKGTTKEQIEALVKKVMAQNQFSMHSIGKIASIDLKQEEQGLLDFCEAYHGEFLTYSREDLEKVSCEEGFSESSFVKGITGVGNVCERSALKASGQTRLIQKKAAENGVTVAIALEKYIVRF